MKTLKNFLCRHSTFVLLSPFVILFGVFIVIPVICAALLSFTRFDSISLPSFVGVQNYIAIFTKDSEFMQKILPNTIKYALLVGPGGYILSFLLAWILAQLTRWPRTFLAIIIYSPSLVGGVALSAVWGVLFSGDKLGYLNGVLLGMNIIDEPVQWLSAEYILPVMILVALWSGMGVGFLAMLSGIMNVNTELYEAAYIDGIKNRAQEVYYVTIPSIRPQMLFGAIMALVNTFSSSGTGVALTGSNPTPEYAGSLIVNHADDYGFLRYEMGYAAALSVVLLVIMWAFSRFAYKLFGEKD